MTPRRMGISCDVTLGFDTLGYTQRLSFPIIRNTFITIMNE